MHFLIELDHLVLCVVWINHILDILQALVIDFVSFGQNIDLLRANVDEDVVPNFKGVKIGMRFRTPALEVFAADKTCVHIDI